MSLQQQSITVDDFSGGITDYVLDAKPNQAAEIENLVINPNRKLESVMGTQIYDDDMYIIPGGGARVCGIFASKYPELFINSAKKIWYPDSVFTELVGPTSNPAFSVGTTAGIPSWTEWNDHIFATNTEFALPIKMYKDGSSVWQVRTAGLPELASSPSATPTAGANTYIYAFHYYYTYTVGTTVFEDYGPTTIVPCPSAADPGASAIAIAAIPTLANGATGNYATTTIKVYIYRTVAGGSTFYKVNEVTNGTAVYSDTMSDTTLQTKLLLYTNSGVLDNDPPPLAKFVHIVNGVAYYAHVKVGTEIFKNRVRQAVQDDPDSCPTDNYIDVLDEITGMSSYGDSPLIFSKNHVYRVNGQYTEDGQGQVTWEDITKTIGCVAHNSIVQTRVGVFWAGNDGFYWTDGFSYKKISDSINERYKQLVSSETRKARICGTYDTKDNRVIWAVTYGDSSSDNDCFFSLDLRWGVRDDSTFTTRSNGSAFSPTSLAFYEGQLIHSDRRGYILKHDASYTSDPDIDSLKVPSLWTTKSIIPLYKSIVSNLGLPNVRKWVTKILLTMENVTNASVQISSINDNSSRQSDLKEIRFRGNVLWGDPNILWGADTPYWSYFNLIEEMRRFNAKYLRCSYKQIIITQAFTNIYNSDTSSTGTVDTGFKTVTLTDTNFAFADDIEDYYITFEDDAYTKEYLITARNSDTQLTFLDAQSTAVAGVKKWVIRGYPKGELFKIISFTVFFAPLTDQSFKTFRSELDSTGGNE
jgi:hypothetical protein